MEVKLDVVVICECGTELEEARGPRYYRVPNGVYVKPCEWCIAEAMEKAKQGWRLGDPSQAGYYLATWQHESGRRMVSELWFNPDAVGHWYTTRAYLRDQTWGQLSAVKRVLAWMPMPEPYDPKGES